MSDRKDVARGSIEARVARLEALLEGTHGGQSEIDRERNASSRALSGEFEKGRDLAERDRAEAEVSREHQEDDRLREERDRVEGEHHRVHSEEIRATQEETRRMAEEAREMAEAVRTETEALREQIVQQDEMLGEMRIALARLLKSSKSGN